MQSPVRFTLFQSGTAPLPPSRCSRRFFRSAGWKLREPYCGSCPRWSGMIHTWGGRSMTAGVGGRAVSATRKGCGPAEQALAALAPASLPLACTHTCRKRHVLSPSFISLCTTPLPALMYCRAGQGQRAVTRRGGGGSGWTQGRAGLQVAGGAAASIHIYTLRPAPPPGWQPDAPARSRAAGSRSCPLNPVECCRQRGARIKAWVGVGLAVSASSAAAGCATAPADLPSLRPIPAGLPCG